MPKGRKPFNNSYFSPHDCNSICDVTGFKTKLSQQKKDWQGFMMIPEAWQTRQPQDFPVIATKQKIHKDSRSEQVHFAAPNYTDDTMANTWAELGFDAAWMCDEPSGDLKPTIGDNDIIYQPATPATYQQAIPGYDYSGVDFGEFRGLPADFFNGNGDFTYTSLIRVRSGAYGVVFSMGATGGGVFLRIIVNASGNFRIGITPNGEIDTGIPSTAGTSYKIAVVRDHANSTITTYIDDGVDVQTSVSMTNSGIPDTWAYINAQAGGTNYFSGVQALIGVKKTAMSAGEIGTLFTQMDLGEVDNSLPIY